MSSKPVTKKISSGRVLLEVTFSSVRGLTARDLLGPTGEEPAPVIILKEHRVRPWKYKPRKFGAISLPAAWTSDQATPTAALHAAVIVEAENVRLRGEARRAAHSGTAKTTRSAVQRGGIETLEHAGGLPAGRMLLQPRVKAAVEEDEDGEDRKEVDTRGKKWVLGGRGGGGRWVRADGEEEEEGKEEEKEQEKRVGENAEKVAEEEEEEEVLKVIDEEDEEEEGEGDAAAMNTTTDDRAAEEAPTKEERSIEGEEGVEQEPTILSSPTRSSQKPAPASSPQKKSANARSSLSQGTLSKKPRL